MKCEICGSEGPYAWTDFHGQVTCMTCGAPYQIKDYSGAPPDEKYPYIDFKKEFAPIFKEYWEKTKKRARCGTWLGNPPEGVIEEKQALIEWLKENHPEVLKSEV